jgi:hypothetical protein
MEFTRSCWGPPVIPLWGLLAFGLGAAVLLVLTWSRFGTKSVLAPWSRGDGSCATASVWRVAEFAQLVIIIVPAMLLTTLASAALWAALPGTPRRFHVGLTYAQFLVACVLSTVVMITADSWLYGIVR